MALKKILAGAEDEDQRFRLTWAMDGLKAKANPVKVDESVLKRYAGDYGERKVRYKKGELFYRRKGPEYRLISLNDRLFQVEGLDYFRIEFVMDASGNVTQLVGIYDDGYRDPSDRTR